MLRKSKKCYKTEDQSGITQFAQGRVMVVPNLKSFQLEMTKVIFQTRTKCCKNYYQRETRTVTKVPYTPTQRLVTEQASCYRKKKNMEVP